MHANSVYYCLEARLRDGVLRINKLETNSSLHLLLYFLAVSVSGAEDMVLLPNDQVLISSVSVVFYTRDV